MDVKEITEKLQAPFPSQEIEWRVQRAVKTKNNGDIMLFVAPYISNRAIMNRLDEVVGPFNWKNAFAEWRTKGTVCQLSLKINDEWVTKEDGAEETDIEGVKGSLSGSMKRAGVQWGIGRYLYKLDEYRVFFNDKGSQYSSGKVKTGRKDQQNRDIYEPYSGKWDPPQLPNWALPDNEKGKQSSQQNNYQNTAPDNSYNASARAAGPPTENQEQNGSNGSIKQGQLNGIQSMAKFKKLTEDELSKIIYIKYGIHNFDEMSEKQAGDFLKELNKSQDELKGMANGA